jgi:hypothetical protein
MGVVMKNTRFGGFASALVLLLIASAVHAQSGSDVYWHTDPGVKSCSMVIDPSLTQSQWSRFVTQAGATVSFKALGSAETLGKMNFKVGLDASSTPVDQHDPAWINSFTHPSSKNCPLGDQIQIPTIRAEMGVSRNVDVGGYWTTAQDANYGLVGAEVKYAFVQHPGKPTAAAVRGSVSLLTGVPDFNMIVYGADFIASRRVALFTPYIGLKESLSVGTETTSKVDLHRETIPITQAYGGVVSSLWKVDLAAEYDVSFVNTFAFTAGVRF